MRHHLIRTASTYVVDLDPKCKCGNYATAFIEVHRVNDCVEEPTLASFKCGTCLELGLLSIDRIYELGGVTCETCGQVIATPSDLIVRVQYLDKQ